MNYPSKLLLAVLAIAASIILPGCLKEYEYVKQHPGAEVTGCRINMLISTPDTFRVHYNTFGDPTEIVAGFTHPSSWQGDYHFRYDKYHRLVDYFWGNPAYSDYRLIWHRYTYIGKSLVSDSQFNYIVNGGGANPPPETFAYLTIDSLDADGRIVKDVEPGNPPSIGYYNYDAKGDLVTFLAEYDNKLNIYHTSKVWMFIEKDYSVNNRLNYSQEPIKITSYNAAGLPLVFEGLPNDNLNRGLLFNVIYYSKLQVVYDCDVANAAGLR